MFHQVRNPDHLRKEVVKFWIEFFSTRVEHTEKMRDVAIVARNVERGILNFAKQECDKKNTSASWMQPMFVHAYFTRFRSLRVNLEDQPALRLAVRNETLSATKLMKMSYFDFNKKWRGVMHLIQVRKSHVNKKEATSDQYECKVCHSKEIRHETDQNRSADEGNSVWYDCLNCGYSWSEL